MSRKVQVKNRAPAPIQITAEQILREANDRVIKEDKAPRVHITDPEELMQVRGRLGGGVFKRACVFVDGWVCARFD
jgi:crooked neck